MLLLALVLILLAFLLIAIAKIWMIYHAFCRSVLWGLAVLFVPFAVFIFLIAAWNEAKRPFLLLLTGIMILVAGIVLLPDKERDPQALLKWAEEYRADLKKQAAAAKATPVPAAAVSMAPATPMPSVEEQIARLKVREADLRARRAALAPGDRAGTEALRREIAQYNVDLKAALERRKAEGK